MAGDETPHPPATAEFGAVTPGGPTHAYPPRNAFSVVKFSVGPYDNNVYVIRSGEEALVVDGATDAPRIMREAVGARVVGIVETHGHPDHIQALPELVAAWGCPVYAHPGDRMPVPAKPLHGGEEIAVGDVVVRTVHTPGHTPGSTCYVLDGYVFSGDALFPGGPGNTGGNAKSFESAMQSLDESLFTLPDYTRVCPGHGLDTTIGRERPYVDVWRKRGW